MNQILDELNSCFSDWEGDFDIELILEYEQNVTAKIKHKYVDDFFYIPCRIKNGNTEMDYAEDCWVDINKGNVFAKMWFDSTMD